MANAIYPEFKEHLLKGDIDIDTATVKAYLVDLADYTYSAAHDLLADLPVAARVASATIANPTSVNGTLDGDNFVFSTANGDESEALVITVDMGGSEYLAAYYDTGVTGLPVIPNGGDINVTVDASGLFTL